MSAEHSIGDPAELAALYAAGAMPLGQAEAFEAHLSDGCAVCREEINRLEPVIDELLSDVQPVDVDAGVWVRLIDRVRGERAAPRLQPWKTWESDTLDHDIIIDQAARSGWERTGVEGVDIRRLCTDHARNQMTAMIRMAPGTSYPAHVHDGPEECLVLEGDLRAGEHHFHAGDYQRMAPGSHHGVQSTDHGCLLLIVSSLTDKIDE